MSYDQDFYTKYHAYLKEPGVRKMHNRAINFAGVLPGSAKVIDLGCGHGMEWWHHSNMCLEYVGVDENASIATKSIRANFRDVDLVASLMRFHGLEGIVSLFGIEPSATQAENTDFYNQLFDKTPALSIVSAGFYYQPRKLMTSVREVGDIISFQTNTCLQETESDRYTETRMEFPCPSEMFGKDVVEVWKFMERK